MVGRRIPLQKQSRVFLRDFCHWCVWCCRSRRGSMREQSFFNSFAAGHWDIVKNAALPSSTSDSRSHFSVESSAFLFKSFDAGKISHPPYGSASKSSCSMTSISIRLKVDSKMVTYCSFKFCLLVMADVSRSMAEIGLSRRHFWWLFEVKLPRGPLVAANLKDG